MSRIAVKMDMADADTIPVTGAEQLDEHLDELLADPDLAPAEKLFDDVELQLTPVNIPPLIPRLLPKIINILKQYQRDPAVLCSLATKLLGPLTFTQAMSMASEDALIQALQSRAPSAKILAMTVLEKASKSPADAAMLAAMKNLMTNFIIQWLSTPGVEVGEKGSKVLGALLEVDCETPLPEGLSAKGLELAVRHAPGQGLMWRRVFHDRDIYGLLLSLTSPGPHQNTQDGVSHLQLTLSQARLLHIMPRLAALNLGATAKTNFADLNHRYSHIETDEGLLHYVALRMVDKEDTLMRLILVDFFDALLNTQRATPYSAFKMDTLKGLMREATRNDDLLKEAILDLPDCPVPEGVPRLGEFIGAIMQPCSPSEFLHREMHFATL